MKTLVLCWGRCWHNPVIPHKHLTGHHGPCPPEPWQEGDPVEPTPR